MTFDTKIRKQVRLQPARPGTATKRPRSLLVLAIAVTLAGCWTMPGAGPQRSGHNPAEVTLTTANVDTLVPDWTWQAE